MCGSEGTDTSDQIQLSHGLGQVPWALFFAHQSCLVSQTSQSSEQKCLAPTGGTAPGAREEQVLLG